VNDGDKSGVADMNASTRAAAPLRRNAPTDFRSRAHQMRASTEHPKKCACARAVLF